MGWGGQGPFSVIRTSRIRVAWKLGVRLEKEGRGSDVVRSTIPARGGKGRRRRATLRRGITPTLKALTFARTKRNGLMYSRQGGNYLTRAKTPTHASSNGFKHLGRHK
eukprot:913850-Pleurochrysis_carterae.AAC.5